MTTSSDIANDQELPIVEHLREFRNRLIAVLVTLTITTIISAPLTGPAMELLVSPLEFKPLSLGPTDNITQYFKVALVGGVALAMPMIIYQLIAFMLPALYPREKKYLFVFIPFATLLFFGGVAFGAYIALPVSLNFLQNFGEDFAQVQWTLEKYTEFVTTLLLALGIGFEMPLVIFLLAKVGIVTFGGLVRNLRWAFLICAVAAAVLTPTPDPQTMLIVMLPLFLLYLLGVGLARFA